MADLIDGIREDHPELPPDQQPGFWPEYVEPRSELARAIQYPWPDDPWAGRVINAYLADEKRARREARKLADANTKGPHP